ncbi:MAG: methylase, partial [Sphingorhabdus sp.]
GQDLHQSLDPNDLASVALKTGKPLSFRSVEALTVKRSLVNGSQRLELTGWSADRLDWYKAQGCFTEIIRYQTRLFVPTNDAGAVFGCLTCRQT